MQKAVGTNHLRTSIEIHMSWLLSNHMLRGTVDCQTHNVIHDHNAKNDGKLFEDEQGTSDVGGSNLADIGGSS